MDQQKIYRAGFDYSGPEAAFAVMDREGNILAETSDPMPNRDSSSLPVVIRKHLSDLNLSFEDICEWTAGTGPGSFTGLRVASAFIMGLSFRKTGIRTRGISTASALALSADPAAKADKVAAVYDGRKKELLAFGLRRNGDFYVPDGEQRVLRSMDDWDNLVKDYEELVSHERDFGAVAAFAGTQKAAIVHCAKTLKASKLISCDPENFSGSLSDLYYLRPAVFVEPKVIRTFE